MTDDAGRGPDPSFFDLFETDPVSDDGEETGSGQQPSIGVTLRRRLAWPVHARRWGLALVTGVVLILLLLSMARSFGFPFSRYETVSDGEWGECDFFSHASCKGLPLSTIQDAVEGLNVPSDSTVLDSDGYRSGSSALAGIDDDTPLYSIRALLKINSGVSNDRPIDFGRITEALKVARQHLSAAQVKLYVTGAPAARQTPGANVLLGKGATDFYRFTGSGAEGPWTAILGIGPHGDYLYIAS